MVGGGQLARMTQQAEIALGVRLRVLSETPDASAEQATELYEAVQAGGRLFVEAQVPFERELSAMVGRSATGETRAWPVVEMVQSDGACTEVFAPAPGLDPPLVAEAQTIAVSIAEDLEVIGVMAVELFQVDGEL